MTVRSFVVRTLLSTCFLAPQLVRTISYARGGSVVGNGAGVVENNFQYAYSMLPSLISTCAVNSVCALTNSEKILLEKIRIIAEANASNADRLIFQDEGEDRTFFETGLSEKHRIAKTGLTAKDPIYVNTEMLYDGDGKTRLDYPLIISILVHEIGHQTGEKDHAILDILGSKLRKLAFDKISPHMMQVGRSQAVDVTIINTESPVRSSEFYFSWQNTGSIKATAALTSRLACAKPEAVISGIEITNGSFFPTRPLNNNTLSEVGFSVWVKLFCYTRADSFVKIENFSVRAIIKKDLTLEVLDSAKLR